MKKILFLLVVGVFSLLGSSILCMGQQPKSGGTLVFGMEEDIVSADTHRPTSRAARRFIQFYADNLVGITNTYEIVPNLAESWELSRNGLEYTFRLRKGVKFHNGRELTAEDVKFNFERILDPKTAAAAKGYYDMVKSIQVVDRYTVKFIFNKPCGAFLSIVGDTSAGIIARESVKQDGTITNPIGTGPFEFVEWKPGVHIKMKKNKNYWVKGIPYVDELLIRILIDPVARLNALKAGDVDITHNLPVSDILQYQKTPPKDFSILMGPTGGAHFISLNLGKPPFNDVRVRKALAYGINKKEMLQAMYQGYGEVVNQLFVKGGPWYLDIPDYTQDKEKARALLKEVYPNGVDVRLTQANSSLIDLVGAQVVQEQLKDVGFRIDFDVVDMATVYARARAGQFVARMDNFGALPDPHILYPWFFVKDAPYHRMVGNGYDNPKVNELLEKGGMASDYKERKRLYTEAAKIILFDDVAIIFTIQTPLLNATGLRSYTKGYQLHPDGWMAYPRGGFAYIWLDK
jgi:peptide/nickel transport system substrate-binding protein